MPNSNFLKKTAPFFLAAALLLFSSVIARAADITNAGIVDEEYYAASPFYMSGNCFFLDADNDTSICADTDDQVDFGIGGADDFRMTANIFSILAGSTITDSVASWTNAILSGFTSITGATITDGTASLTGGVGTGYTLTTPLITAGGTINLSAAGTLGIATNAGANTITIGGATSTVDIPGSLVAGGFTVEGNVGSGDINLYDPVNDGNPAFNIGSTSANRGTLTANYDTGLQTLKNFTISTTSATTGNIILSPASGFVGIGTTTPSTLLQIANNGWFSAKNNAGDGAINMFKVNASDEIEIGGVLIAGSMEFAEDSGAVTAMDMSVSATPVAGTEESYVFKIDGTNILKIYAEADSAGGIQNQNLISEVPFHLKEIAAANADTAAYGQIWVKTATPNELWFTDDAGTDAQLGTGSGVTAVTGTSPVASSGGATPAISIPAATNLAAGHATAAHITAIEANTAKNTNVSTALSAGTVNATTYGITSDGGADDIVLPEATTTLAGILGAAKWNEIVANTAKVTNATHTGDATGATALTVVGINGTLTSGLATGILKNTTTTGVPSIAIAADFPTLNQSTTGSAATLETTRAIYGNNFNGSAALTQIIASTYGGTGNGFTKFTGATTAERIYTLPDASATILYSGGDAGTPSALVGTNISGTGASFTAGNVTTNANLTGIVTSVGNATAIADKAIGVAKLADGTDGELITWSATGVAATVGVGTVGQTLTSGGIGVAPTFQSISLPLSGGTMSGSIAMGNNNITGIEQVTGSSFILHNVNVASGTIAFEANNELAGSNRFSVEQTGISLGNSAGAILFSVSSSTGEINIGHASDTTLARSAAGVLAVEGVVIPSISSTNTFTNKRITPRVTTEASSATPTINTDNSDAHSITALALAITSMTTNLSGTPTNFQKLTVRILDNGTARAITWGASFADKGVALPTTTVISKSLTVEFIYDSVAAVWGCVTVANET